MSKEPPVDDKPPVDEKVVAKDPGTEYIIGKSILIKDIETGEKFVTITISEKMMHYIFEGLGKYKEAFRADTGEDLEERTNANKLIDEFTDIKAIINEEVIVKTKGLQEPNPVEDTEGIPNDST